MLTNARTRTVIQFLISAWLLPMALPWLAATGAHAEPLSVHYRCGSETSLAKGAPTEGWTHAANGRIPGKAAPSRRTGPQASAPASSR